MAERVGRAIEKEPKRRQLHRLGSRCVFFPFSSCFFDTNVCFIIYTDFNLLDESVR